MHLYTKSELEHIQDKSWQLDAYRAFHEKFINKTYKFPCIPATQGYQLDQLRFVFLPSPLNSETSSYLAELLEHYGKKAKKIGDYTSLVLFLERTKKEEGLSVTAYEDWFWNLLQEVHEIDSTPWPEEIPQDPHDPLWEYCFNGERYFLFCATPSHEKRQSRYFPFMMLAITPRWVFQTFLEKPGAGKIKGQIRERLTKYDAVAPHPDLNVYGSDDNYEYKQYFLRDDQSSSRKCPFHVKKHPKS
ncbi:YqcI/YcgG family protein [Radiobacillus deserti]|uniref:YqcI/YcgG family protein n=1 Tax=Radiobacillus deserti TaxID=2594883 RepID=A0A516KCG6_9BACI|nr:YqcI/YcgG family protein [Radiobacillus deserti]QDP39060.1 YqcI/YcgG family protein [Radiobacillus deserti]